MVPEKINIATVHDRLIEGIKNFFDQCGTEKAIIGLSGGIDSAVVASLAVQMVVARVAVQPVVAGPAGEKVVFVAS